MNNAIQPLVSVIVPIYKVEKYLEKCIDSILSQDYRLLEIILVDDGSPDKSPMICDRYAGIDRRIKVIHQANGGLSAARNTGIETARGVYIAFVDSDDYLEANFISTLVQQAIKERADISVCSYRKIYEKNKSKMISPLKRIHSTSFTNIEAIRDIFSTSSLCEVMTWNKLYKKNLFIQNDIRFPVGKVHEDNFTTYKLFHYSNKITFINEPLYCYLQRSESIMGNGFSNKSLDMIEAADQAVQWVTDNRLPLSREVACYRLSTVINLLNTMVDRNRIDKSIWRELTSGILKDKEELLKNKYVNNKQRQLIRLLNFGVYPYVLMRKAYKLVGLIGRVQ